jgi:hypothetical protein
MMVEYEIEVVNFLWRHRTKRYRNGIYCLLASKLRKPALRRQAQGAGFFCLIQFYFTTAAHPRLLLFLAKKDAIYSLETVSRSPQLEALSSAQLLGWPFQARRHPTAPLRANNSPHSAVHTRTQVPMSEN